MGKYLCCASPIKHIKFYDFYVSCWPLAKVNNWPNLIMQNSDAYEIRGQFEWEFQSSLWLMVLISDEENDSITNRQTGRFNWNVTKKKNAQKFIGYVVCIGNEKFADSRIVSCIKYLKILFNWNLTTVFTLENLIN